MGLTNCAGGLGRARCNCDACHIEAVTACWTLGQEFLPLVLSFLCSIHIFSVGDSPPL